MKKNLKDILSNLHSEVDQETLLKYLEGRLSSAQQHEVEKNLLQDDFEADALEGLQQIKDKQKISALVEQLNLDLKKKTIRKEQWSKKKDIKVEIWLLFAIVLILLLAILGYVVIKKNSPPTPRGGSGHRTALTSTTIRY